MSSVDSFGLSLSCDAAAAEPWRLGAERLLAGTGDPVAAADQAIAADPDFALAWALRARGLLFRAEMQAARDAVERAIELAPGTSRREQQHVALAKDLVFNRPETLDRSREHLEEWPLDALVLAPAAGVFGLIGFSGRVQREAEQLALLEPLAQVYGDHWWFRTILAFALLETGSADRATELASEAWAARPDSGHVAHTLVHAQFEAGRHEQARQWLADWLPTYPAADMLYCHLWWHLGLFHVLRRDFPAVWSVFDERCGEGLSNSPPINIFTDRAALIWRAQLQGADVDETRWRDLYDYAARNFPKPGVFVDVHYILTLVALEHWQELDEFEARCRVALEGGRLRAGGVVLELLAGFRAFGQARWADAAASLEAALSTAVCIGGSRAQRRIVDETLAVARARAGART